MRPELTAAFGAHGHLLTRRQAVEAGATPAEIDRWVRTGAWVNVRRGVYACASSGTGSTSGAGSRCTSPVQRAPP